MILTSECQSQNSNPKTKCTIRAWFVNHGISIEKGEKAWHSGRAIIDSFRKPIAECEPSELWKGELDLELTQLDSLTTQLEGAVKKTRKKKAAVALARKIAVLAWAMLRDEKDWDLKTMIDVTESYGRMPLGLKESLQSMKPKENSDQRKSRLRREAREASESQEATANAEATPATKEKTSKSLKRVAKEDPTNTTKSESQKCTKDNS